MHTPATLSIMHHLDPWGQGIGGFDTCIDAILRHAPQEWAIELIGMSTDPAARPPGRWLTVDYHGRPLRFCAALVQRDPDRVHPVPISLRYALACRLRRLRPSGSLIQFHRFETGYATQTHPGQHTIFYLHNHPVDYSRRTSDLRWRRAGTAAERVALRMVRDATLVVCVDPKTPEWIRTNHPGMNDRVLWLREWAEPQIFHVADGAAREADRARLREELGAPSGAKVVGYVGRFTSPKDLPLLLQAFEHLAGRDPDLRLILLGKGKQEGELRRASECSQLRGRVHFLAPRPRNELAAVYRALDALTCTSTFEGGPRVVFEALACGTPVVAFEVGQVAAVLRDAPVSVGAMVPQRSAEAFAAALGRVLDLPSGIARAQACAAAVREHTPQRALDPIFHRYRTELQSAGVPA